MEYGVGRKGQTSGCPREGRNTWWPHRPEHIIGHKGRNTGSPPVRHKYGAGR